MHLLVGKPALEALVRDIDVEAETHFIAFCKILWLFAICNGILHWRLWSETFMSKPILWLLAKYFGFCNRGLFWSETLQDRSPFDGF